MPELHSPVVDDDAIEARSAIVNVQVWSAGIVMAVRRDTTMKQSERSTEFIRSTPEDPS